MKKNKINVLSDNEIKKILNESKSFRDAIIKFGYSSNGSGGYRLVKKELKIKNIKIPKYQIQYIFNYKLNRKKNEEVFVENSSYARHHLKQRIIKEKLIEYKCSECGNIGEWNGKKITLQLEHKNGINDDNRLENLTFLCPNCHSQTKTYSGKSKYKNKNKQQKKYKEKMRKVKRPPYEQLIKEINELGYCGTGRKYNVSDNSIRKWKKQYEKIK